MTHVTHWLSHLSVVPIVQLSFKRCYEACQDFKSSIDSIYKKMLRQEAVSIVLHTVMWVVITCFNYLGRSIGRSVGARLHFTSFSFLHSTVEFKLFITHSILCR